MAPEYIIGGFFSVKSDVYSFGVMVLEIAIGEKNSNFRYEVNGVGLVSYVSLTILCIFKRGTSTAIEYV